MIVSVGHICHNFTVLFNITWLNSWLPSSTAFHSIPLFAGHGGKKIGEWAVKDDFPITGYNCYNRLFRCWVVERFWLGLVEMEVFHKQSTALGSLGLGISQCFSLCRWTFPFLTKHAACHVSPTGPKKNHWILRFSTGDVRFTADVPGIGSLQLGPFGANHKGPLPKCCNRPGGYQILPDDIENCHLVRWFAIEDGAFPSFLYVYQRVIIYI